MSDKPFWSSAPGVVTGVASIVTAIVGLLGISVQAGWIGGDDGQASTSSADGGPTTTASTASTVFGSATTTTVTVRVGEFSVEPDSVTFKALEAKEATVTVKNTGAVPLTIRKPVVSGLDTDAFKVTDENCSTSTLARSLSCEIRVTFSATQPGDFEAKLVVAASNVTEQVEVPLKGNRGLLG